MILPVSCYAHYILNRIIQCWYWAVCGGDLVMPLLSEPHSHLELCPVLHSPRATPIAQWPLNLGEGIYSPKFSFTNTHVFLS